MNTPRDDNIEEEEDAEREFSDLDRRAFEEINAKDEIDFIIKVSRIDGDGVDYEPSEEERETTKRIIEQANEDQRKLDRANKWTLNQLETMSDDTIIEWLQYLSRGTGFLEEDGPEIDEAQLLRAFTGEEIPYVEVTAYVLNYRKWTQQWINLLREHGINRTGWSLGSRNAVRSFISGALIRTSAAQLKELKPDTPLD